MQLETRPSATYFKTCANQECGEVFETRYAHKKYCSEDCKFIVDSQKHKQRRADAGAEPREATIKRISDAEKKRRAEFNNQWLTRQL